MAYYNRKIGEKEFDLAYQVKSYLDSNFCDPDLSVELIADYFNVTYKTLLNHFKKRHNITVQEYYTALRMERAIEMMREHNLKTD